MGRAKLDISGNTYKWLTPIEEINKNALKSGNKIWLFECICGELIEATASGVHTGHISSCGCKKGVVKLDDLTGQRFGRLIPTGYMPRFFKQKNRQVKKIYWHCECDCGGSKWVPAKTLKNSATKSCGCLHREAVAKNNKSRNTGYKSISGQYISAIKYCARERGIEYKVSAEYMWGLFEKQNEKCALSGLNITLDRGSSNDRVKKQTASLDRIDSSSGYLEGNVQWLHKTVNKIKWNLRQDEFIKICQLIANNNNN